jgi:hypothetical protein
MAINGLPCDHSVGFGAGLASSNDMDVEGIKSGDNLLAVISWDSSGNFVGHDVTDFTVGNGTLNASSISLASETFVAIWTNAPDGT